MERKQKNMRRNSHSDYKTKINNYSIRKLNLYHVETNQFIS